MADDERRAQSFGAIAERYDRYRPGPSSAVAEFLCPDHIDLAVDLGAGTGALSALLVGRARTVVAVEPDARMRAVLARRLPEVRVVPGAGESIPLDDGAADGVFASSSWHWMEPAATVAEVARVLRPGGRLGVTWSGPDYQSNWFAQLRPREVLARAAAAGEVPPELGDSAADLGSGRSPAGRQHHVLELPPAAPFEVAERAELTWTRAMTADEIVGMLTTYSGVILASAERREALERFGLDHLARTLGLAGEARAEVPFRAVCWRTVRTAAA